MRWPAPPVRPTALLGLAFIEGQALAVLVFAGWQSAGRRRIAAQPA